MWRQIMNGGPTLSIGSTGHDVRRLQRIFVTTKVLAPGDINGTFDSTTEQAASGSVVNRITKRSEEIFNSCD